MQKKPGIVVFFKKIIELHLEEFYRCLRRNHLIAGGSFSLGANRELVLLQGGYELSEFYESETKPPANSRVSVYCFVPKEYMERCWSELAVASSAVFMPLGSIGIETEWIQRITDLEGNILWQQ